METRLYVPWSVLNFEPIGVLLTPLLMVLKWGIADTAGAGFGLGFDVLLRDGFCLMHS